MQKEIFAIYADIGGTHARFALQMDEDSNIESVKVYASVNYHEPCAVLFEYLASMEITKAQHVVIGIAAPIHEDVLELTNVAWKFSLNACRESISQRLATQSIYFINDFESLAYALPYLTKDEKIQVGEGEGVTDQLMSLIGPGTGVGVSHLVHVNGLYRALGCEGGHILYAPQDFEEIEILKIIMQKSPVVTLEHVLSGGYGITNLIHAMACVHGIAPPNWRPQDLFEKAFEAKDAFALSVLSRYCAILGSAAGNIALVSGAMGGVYIGGGIVPKLGAYFFQSSFRRCFEAKASASAYIKPMPTFVITAEFPGLLGVKHSLNAFLNSER